MKWSGDKSSYPVNCQDIHPVSYAVACCFARQIQPGPFQQSLYIKWLFQSPLLPAEKQTPLPLHPGQEGFLHWAKRKPLDCRCLSEKKGKRKWVNQCGCWVDGHRRNATQAGFVGWHPATGSRNPILGSPEQFVCWWYTGVCRAAGTVDDQQCSRWRMSPDTICMHLPSHCSLFLCTI